jgi:hypothetical protein
MVRKMRAIDAERLDWRPKHLGIGLHEMALASAPKLTRADFGIALKKYLQERGSSLDLERRLIDRLYQHTVHCRQQGVAVKKMHQIIHSRDWERREAVFRYLQKKMDSFVRGLRKYRDVKFPLTDMLVRSVNTRVVNFTKSVKHDLNFYARMTANEKEVVSGYLKPELESQYMLDIFDIVANRHRSLAVAELLMVVAGCVHVGKILPDARDEDDLHNLIDMRIRRARRALLRESAKFEWGSADDFSKIFLPYPKKR